MGLAIEPIDKPKGIFKLNCEKTRDDEPFSITLQARPYLDQIGTFAILTDAQQTVQGLDSEKIIAAVSEKPGINQQELIQRCGSLPEARADLAAETGRQAALKYAPERATRRLFSREKKYLPLSICPAKGRNFTRKVSKRNDANNLPWANTLGQRPIAPAPLS